MGESSLLNILLIFSKNSAKKSPALFRSGPPWVLLELCSDCFLPESEGIPQLLRALLEPVSERGWSFGNGLA